MRPHTACITRSPPAGLSCRAAGLEEAPGADSTDHFPHCSAARECERSGGLREGSTHPAADRDWRAHSLGAMNRLFTASRAHSAACGRGNAVRPAAAYAPVMGHMEAAEEPWREGSQSAALEDQLEARPALFAGKYQLLELLGKGGSGAVYSALDHSVAKPRQVAVKVSFGNGRSYHACFQVRCSRRGAQGLKARVSTPVHPCACAQREFEIMQQLQHPELVKKYGRFAVQAFETGARDLLERLLSVTSPRSGSAASLHESASCGGSPRHPLAGEYDYHTCLAPCLRDMETIGVPTHETSTPNYANSAPPQSGRYLVMELLGSALHDHLSAPVVHNFFPSLRITLSWRTLTAVLTATLRRARWSRMPSSMLLASCGASPTTRCFSTAATSYSPACARCTSPAMCTAT